MIPRAFISEWRSHVLWAEDWQVEQDLVISRALVEIFSDDFLRRSLAFRGGTALHKLHFRPAERYSEDIDLVRVDAGPIGPILDRLRDRLESWLGRGQYQPKDRMSTFRFRFESESLPPVRLRLKVEINVREHFALGGLQSVPFQVDSRWFSGVANVTTFSLEELLATKLRALYQRSKGRDAFDLDRSLNLPSPPNVQRVVDLFLEYMDRDGKKVSRAEFEKNLYGKRNDSDFLNDISTLLTADAPSYDSQAGLARVEQAFVGLIPGEPWAGLGSP